MAEESIKNNQFSNFSSFFKRITFKQRLYLIFGAIITLVAILVVVNIITAVNYGILFSNLSLKDSGLIIAKLQESKVPYKLGGNGGIIKVPEDKIPELRIELASEGLPEGGGVGFELFDNNSLSINDFTQQVNYIRAKEGEIARSISSLKEILAAKVHITVPEDSVFIDEKQDAKASIVLKLKPGAYLSSSIVPAICHLTAQAVEGLRIENIAVIDMNGQLLSKPMNKKEGSNNINSSEQFTYKKELEDRLKTKIYDLLAPLVGNGGLSINVDLDLDFNAQETKREIVDPDKTAKVSEQIETNSTKGSKSQGGVPGVASNVAQSQTQQPSNGNSSESKSERSTTNYEVSKTITHSVKQLGTIQRVSAAIIVGNKVESSIVEGELVKESIARTPEEIAEITRLVKATIGFNAQRGDMVEVANAPFDKSRELEMDIALKAQKKQDLFDKLFKYGFYLVAGLFLFLFIIRPFISKSKTIIQSALQPGSFKKLHAAKEETKHAELVEAEEDEALQREMEMKFKIPKSTKKKEIMLNKVKGYTNDNIDETVSVIRTILNED